MFFQSNYKSFPSWKKTLLLTFVLALMKILSRLSFHFTRLAAPQIFQYIQGKPIDFFQNSYRNIHNSVIADSGGNSGLRY